MQSRSRATGYDVSSRTQVNGRGRVRSRLVLVAALAAVTLVAALPAAALATSEISVGANWGYTYSSSWDPAGGRLIRYAGPVLTFHAVSDEGLTGQYSLDAGAFVSAVDGTKIPVSGACPSIHTVQWRWADGTGAPTVTGPVQTFALDNVGPSTTAVNSIRVRQNGRARFRFTVADQGVRMDMVTIKVKTPKGRLVGTLYTDMKDCSTPAETSVRVKVAIPAGTYRWFVYAADGCRNRQTLLGRNTLKVTR
jgi:hypothetical protein